jgi:outer membrane lipoprotein
MGRLLAIAIIALLLAGCAHAISKNLREEALSVPFQTVKENVDEYKGSLFIWGGFIADARPSAEGTTLEIVQNPLDRYGAPENTDVSHGRFLARVNKTLDPLIYKRERLVTVAGDLVGKQEEMQGGRTFTLPVLRVKELKLWKTEEYTYPYTGYYYWPDWYYWPSPFYGPFYGPPYPGGPFYPYPLR